MACATYIVKLSTKSMHNDVKSVVLHRPSIAEFRKSIQATIDDPGFKIGSKAVNDALTDAVEIQKVVSGVYY